MAYQRRRNKRIVINHAKLQWRPNFSGNPDQNFSPEDHSRNFTVIVEDGNADMEYGYAGDMRPLSIEDLIADGWNVKWTKPDDEGNQTAYIPVTVSYKKIEPKIIKAIGTPDHKVRVREDTVSDLDDEIIIDIDILTINGSRWENVNGSGTKAYLTNMFVTVEDDPFMRTYGAGLNDSFEEDDLPF